jgi:hypothetical protein
MSKHTPTPWKVFVHGRVTEVHDKDSKAIVSWMGFDEPDRTLATHRANARLIVKAVNAYAAKTAEAEKRKRRSGSVGQSSWNK